ncbi:MAG TPA: DNA-3-methyladenine glycosylase I [Edaphocola sp.]|nr:DNA-3-methyladenine glycosylase I [Edaphocola sp.]
MSYCAVIKAMKDGEQKQLHQHYHDNWYGFPLHNDNELFGRFVLEIFQAGLSWNTILQKEENFKKAFDNFDILKIAAYDDLKIESLLENAGIIRNRLKINSVIYNANIVLGLQKDFGSFEKWLDFHHPLSLQDWVKLFKKTFKFTGSEIVNEFLMSVSYLPGAHEEHCPEFEKIKQLNAKWLEQDKNIKH